MVAEPGSEPTAAATAAAASSASPADDGSSGRSVTTPVPEVPNTAAQQVIAQIKTLNGKMAELEAFGGEGIMAYLTKLQASMEKKMKEMEVDLEELKNSNGFGGSKEILEYKGIQGMDKLTSSKGYRTWNEKFKNAMNGARRKGRLMLEFIESIKAKDVQKEWEFDHLDSLRLRSKIRCAISSLDALEPV